MSDWSAVRRPRQIARTQRDSARGQSLVEFALVLPIFLMLVFGLIDTGRFVFMHSALSQAAREGARLGAVEAYWVQSTWVGPAPVCSNTGGGPQAPKCPATPAVLRQDILDAANREMTPFANITIAQLYTSCDASTPPSGNWTTTTCTNNQPGNLLSVRVVYSITPMTPLISRFFPSITSTASATMVIN